MFEKKNIINIFKTTYLIAKYKKKWLSGEKMSGEVIGRSSIFHEITQKEIAI